MSKIVLDYHNSLLRESDTILLENGNWINDNIIAFYFEYLERTVAHKFKVNYINPSTSQMAKFLSSEELISMLGDLNLQNSDFSFIAVNNNYSADDPGGSHWSLLFFNRADKTFTHFDSLVQSNAASADILVNKFKHIFKCPEGVTIHKECPQQANCFDCGVYVISFTDFLSNNLLGTEHRTIHEAVTSVAIEAKREEVKVLIQSLSTKDL